MKHLINPFVSPIWTFWTFLVHNHDPTESLILPNYDLLSDICLLDNTIVPFNNHAIKGDDFNTLRITDAY